MQPKSSLAFALVLSLIIPSLAFSQPPAGSEGGNGGRDIPGAGRNDGRDGGGRRFGGDPNQFFDRLSNGKDVINRSENTDPGMQMMFDRMAERLGVTNGQITRAQFTEMMRQRMQGRAGGPGGGPSGPAAASGNQGGPSPGNNAERISGWAEAMFRQLDQNGDGVLNNDEMPEALRAERDKWDTDHNGLIDLNEFKAYFQARIQQFQADRNALGGQAFPAEALGLDPNVIPPPVVEEERKPVVYRIGKLPKELPAWFTQLDTDKDGQIGLYEWRAAGRPIAEFMKIDRNGDGFLTVEEVLRYVAQAKNGGGPAGTVSPEAVGSPSNPGRSASDNSQTGTRIAGYQGGDQTRSSRRGSGNRQSRSFSPNP
jgi:hypothetical protein